MYIPMYKNRMYENIFLNKYGHLFEHEKIMPYIEVIDLKIGKKEYDEESIVMHYDGLINTKYFIDFFTFLASEYSQIDTTKLKYSLDLRSETPDKYIKRLKSTKVSNKAIPVISIKRGREKLLDVESIKAVIRNLQIEKEEIAVRIEAFLYSKFKDVITSLLRESDYLFYDIMEESTDPFILDLMDFDNDDKFKKIITSSPRKRDITNASYLESGYTDLIDNHLRKDYKELFFDGSADYSGLKDDLPKAGGGGYGAALAMLYDFKMNSYYTITNKDTKDGSAGYEFVIHELERDLIKKKLRLNDDCLAYQFIKDEFIETGKNGNYAKWNLVTLIRQLSEIKLSTKYYL